MKNVKVWTSCIILLIGSQADNQDPKFSLLSFGPANTWQSRKKLGLKEAGLGTEQLAQCPRKCSEQFTAINIIAYQNESIICVRELDLTSPDNAFLFHVAPAIIYLKALQ